MDRVRFGRALGGGARDAARALLKAADAAAAPNPTPTAQAPARPLAPPAKTSSSATPRPDPIPAQRLRRGGKLLLQSTWANLSRQSSVLWLEFTGVFFGLFALTAGIGVCKHRADLFVPGQARVRVWFALAMLLIFGYFTLSSFVRAIRRGRN